MADQYVEAASEERIRAAVALSLRLWAGAPARTLSDAVDMAAARTFCACVAGAEDAIEHHLSALHEGLAAEVLERAQRIVRARARQGPPSSPDLPDEGRTGQPATLAERPRYTDVVDLASDLSFPASDPPAWIGTRLR